MKINAKLPSLILFVMLGTAGFVGDVWCAGKELQLEVKAHRYSGALADLEASLRAVGYLESGAFFVKNGDHPWETDSNVMGVEWCLRSTKQPHVAKQCMFLIQVVLERDSQGKPKFKTEDALEFFPASGFEFLAEGDECMDRAFPNRSVVAIGRWKERKSPQVGGYAYSIRQAWIVDPNIRKFVEISPSEVSCEINEDRD